MSMVACIQDLARLLLLTDLDVLNPFVGQNFVETRAVVNGHLQHTPDDIAAFARENA